MKKVWGLAEKEGRPVLKTDDLVRGLAPESV